MHYTRGRPDHLTEGPGMRTSAACTLTLAATLTSLALATPANAVHEKLDVTGLTAADRLVTFHSDTVGGVEDEVAVTGLNGDDLVAIDYRPNGGALYGVATGADGARLYVINRTTGVATRVGSTTYPITGAISIDFNPVVDRLRVVSSDGTNLRVHPDTGALAATDRSLAYAASDVNAGRTPAVGGVAYTNSDTDPATSTELFDVDAAVDSLARQSPPNDGTLTTRGPLPTAIKAGKTGFDIYTRDSGAKQNWAFVSTFAKGRTTIYEISTATGAKTSNFIGNGGVLEINPHLTDIALPVDQGGAF